MAFQGLLTVPKTCLSLLNTAFKQSKLLPLYMVCFYALFLKVIFQTLFISPFLIDQSSFHLKCMNFLKALQRRHKNVPRPQVKHDIEKPILDLKKYDPDGMLHCKFHNCSCVICRVIYIFDKE